jgi:hypothetical protein
MTLLIAFLVALAPAAPAANPLAGLSPDSVASVLVTRIVVPRISRYSSTDVNADVSFAGERCTLDRADAGAFAAAAGRARPLTRRRRRVEAGLAIAVRLDDGQAIGVIVGARAIYGDVDRSTIMIEGQFYTLDRRSLRAMRAVMARCSFE